MQQLKGKLLPQAKPAAALEKVAVTAEMKVRFPAVGLVVCCVQRWVCRFGGSRCALDRLPRNGGPGSGPCPQPGALAIPYAHWFIGICMHSPCD